jgi:hypothetical protein
VVSSKSKDQHSASQNNQRLDDGFVAKGKSSREVARLQGDPGVNRKRLKTLS